MINRFIEIWGSYAMFTRPELKIERYSYDVPTPSALRGILEAIYWHPGVEYQIYNIHVLNKIKHQSITKNEIKEKMSIDDMKVAISNGKWPSNLDVNKVHTQRANVYLTDVKYIIEYGIKFDGNIHNTNGSLGKVEGILRRRIQKGQYYKAPVLGTKECTAYFHEATSLGSNGYYDHIDNVDFGLMLHHMDYHDGTNMTMEATPAYYHAIMHNGIIHVSGSEIYR